MNSLTFIAESNRIEGIHRLPTIAEVDEHERFMRLDVLSVADLRQFVSVYQPGAKLRDRKGLDVRVGNHIPPEGGPHILKALEQHLAELSDPWLDHVAYEMLHPFTDGNGRSGRALWAWQMTRQRGYPLGFLHHFYYQTLQAAQKAQS